MTLVVAKLVRPHLVEDKHALRRLKRESEHLLRLRHPVIVRGLDSVLDGDRPHVLMEHLEGPNLASLIRRFGSVDLEQLMPLALQLCSAVHYLGSRSIVHLDIKPRNIIMGAPPRLIDLSVARTMEESKQIRNPIGTDPYMAPEQIDLSLPSPGPGTDVFGLGASLYHAISGSVPFPRPDYDKERDVENLPIRFPQLEQPPESLPDAVPVALRDTIMATLAPDPAARPTPVDLVAAIQPLVASLPSRPILRRVRPGSRLQPKRGR